MDSTRDTQPSPQTPSPASGRQDRRLRGQRTRKGDRRMQRAEGPPRRRLAIGIAVVFLLGIAAVVGFGYYDKFVAPTKVLAARVGKTRYSQGDLVDRMRVLQADARAEGQPFDLGRTPFEVLDKMSEAEVIRRFASEYSVQVTDDDIELGLLLRFFPRVPEGQESVSGQVEQEYKDTYQRFLNESHISDKAYRQIVEETVYRSRLRAALGELVPTSTEQVEVHWIRVQPRGGLPILGQAQDVSPDQVLRMLETADFDEVAGKVSIPGIYADARGYVGWVPKGAFPRLDPVLFGDLRAEPSRGTGINPPVSTEDGTYITRVTRGPEVREISEVMRDRLKDQALDVWLGQKKIEGSDEGWLEVKFDSKIYAWVIEQMDQTAGPPTPEPAAQ